MLVNELDEASLDIAKETAKAVTKEVYADVGHPIAKPTGELVGLVPRAIRAALHRLKSGSLSGSIMLQRRKNCWKKS